MLKSNSFCTKYFTENYPSKKAGLMFFRPLRLAEACQNLSCIKKALPNNQKRRVKTKQNRLFLNVYLDANY